METSPTDFFMMPSVGYRNPTYICFSILSNYQLQPSLFVTSSLTFPALSLAMTLIVKSIVGSTLEIVFEPL